MGQFVDSKTRSAYPCWRREHCRQCDLGYLCRGLSPLARGTLLRTIFIVSLPRFIPAGAGNTLWNENVHVIKPVYPRWRGEHLKKGMTKLLDRGLSPLARGTPSP